MDVLPELTSKVECALCGQFLKHSVQFGYSNKQAYCHNCYKEAKTGFKGYEKLPINNKTDTRPSNINTCYQFKNLYGMEKGLSFN